MPQPQVRVNGVARSLEGVPTYTTTLDFLRGLGLTGCKEGCAEGECGACSVMIARPGVTTPTQWVAVNSCLLPIASLDGQEIVTSEGLGTPAHLHPVQHEMARRGGSQCGYCTPGFVCSMAAEYYRPDRDDAGAGRDDPDNPMGPNGFELHALSGNLCRCTGYRPIADAAYSLGRPDEQDILARRSAAEPAPVPATDIDDGQRSFVRPADLATALGMLAEHPGASVIAGCTDWGVEVNLRGRRGDYVVAVDRLPELRELTITPDAIDIGAALTLSEIEARLGDAVPLLTGLFWQFASRLIRNGATIGGNLGTGSPIGDCAPALLALEASLVLAGPNGEREMPLADYFTGYRTSVRAPGELIKSIRIPLPLSRVSAFHKIAKRRFDDISSVAVAFSLDIADGPGGDRLVRKARIGVGGVAATPIRARATEAALEGKPWTERTVEAAARVLHGEGTPMDDHRASADYRAATLGDALMKLYVESVSVPEEVSV